MKRAGVTPGSMEYYIIPRMDYGFTVYVPDAVALAVCPVLKAFAFKTLDPVSVNGFP